MFEIKLNQANNAPLKKVDNSVDNTILYNAVKKPVLEQDTFVKSSENKAKTLSFKGLFNRRKTKTPPVESPTIKLTAKAQEMSKLKDKYSQSESKLVSAGYNVSMGDSKSIQEANQKSYDEIMARLEEDHKRSRERLEKLLEERRVKNQRKDLTDFLKDPELTSSFSYASFECRDRAYGFCPEFRNVYDKNSAQAMDRIFALSNLLKNPSFDKLNKKQQQVLLMAGLLQDDCIDRTAVDVWKNKRYSKLNISDSAKAELGGIQQEKSLFELAESLRAFKANKNLDDFPIITDENLNEMFKTFVQAFTTLTPQQEQFLDSVVQRNRDLVGLSDKNAQIVYETPFNVDEMLKNANSELKIGNDIYPILDLTLLDDNEDVSKFGFPKGLKKSDLRFYVHMIGSNRLYVNWDDIKDFNQRALNYDYMWSKSFITPDMKKTFANRAFGFVTEPKIGQMHSSYVDGRSTGYQKDLSSGLEELLKTGDKTRLNDLPDALKKELGLSDDDYVELVKKLKTEGNIFSKEYDDFEISLNNRKIKIDDLRKAVRKSQDRLLKLVDLHIPRNTTNNEIIDETCDIKAIICKKRDEPIAGLSEDIQIDKSGIDEESKYVVARFIDDYKRKTGKTLLIIMI